MKRLKFLTDREILHREGLSKKPPRKTARAIVRNLDGLFAVMYSEKFHLHSLPGGGVEAGEDILTALRREISEETGATSDIIRELGIVFENRACHDFTQENHYFFVISTSPVGEASLTKKEAAVGAHVKWMTFEKLYEVISRPHHRTAQRKYIQARDMAALNEYRRLTERENKKKEANT